MFELLKKMYNSCRKLISKKWGTIDLLRLTKENIYNKRKKGSQLTNKSLSKK